MTSEELTHGTIRDLSGLLRRRKLSPVELLDATLSRIELENPKLNAYITVLSEPARAEAKQAEQEIQKGRYRGSLHGIPVSVKDLFYTRGIRTTAGSKIFADFVPTSDAVVVTALRQAGAVLVGKTNLHELAYGITTNNPHYGPVLNPHRDTQIPGGSSGGSGAAVAAGLCVASLGTDTGGSIRVPASYCGVVGFKPTFDLVSRDGVIPLGWSLDHVGPLTRTVWDAVVMLQAIAPSVRPRDLLARIKDGIRGLVVGVPEIYFFDRLAPEVEQAVRAAIRKFEQLGARIEPLRLPGMEDATELSRITLLAEATALHQRDLRTRRQDFGDDVRLLLEQGEFILATDYLNAQRGRCRFINELVSAFSKVAVILTPTTPITAPRIGELQVQVPGGNEDVRLATTRLVRALNFAGVPALSIPCGTDSLGLPIGLQIIGKAGDDVTVLRCGHAFEAATKA